MKGRDWRIDDVAAVCQEFGVDCVKPSRGSHYRVAHFAMERISTIPAAHPVKPAYIRALVAYIEAVEVAAKNG